MGVFSHAQSLEPTVVSSAGAVFSDGTNTLSWTAGEVAIETFDTGNEILTQGFHQPYTAPNAVQERSFNWTVYPNPSNGENIRVGWSGAELPEELALYDLAGKLVRAVPIVQSTSSIVLNFSNIEDGMYLLVIRCDAYQETVRLSITH